MAIKQTWFGYTCNSFWAIKKNGPFSGVHKILDQTVSMYGKIPFKMELEEYPANILPVRCFCKPVNKGSLFSNTYTYFAFWLHLPAK